MRITPTEHGSELLVGEKLVLNCAADTKPNGRIIFRWLHPNVRINFGEVVPSKKLLTVPCLILK